MRVRASKWVLRTCSNQGRLRKLCRRTGQEPRGLMRKKRSGSGHSISKSTWTLKWTFSISKPVSVQTSIVTSHGWGVSGRPESADPEELPQRQGKGAERTVTGHEIQQFTGDHCQALSCTARWNDAVCRQAGGEKSRVSYQSGGC